MTSPPSSRHLQSGTRHCSSSQAGSTGSLSVGSSASPPPPHTRIPRPRSSLAAEMRRTPRTSPSGPLRQTRQTTLSCSKRASRTCPSPRRRAAVKRRAAARRRREIRSASRYITKLGGEASRHLFYLVRDLVREMI